MWKLVLPALVFATSVPALDCNGHAELCNRKYSNISFMGAHNSPFVGVGPADNQLDPVGTQLDGGVRFLTAQTHDKDGAIQLCHTSCALEDAGTLDDFLGTVKTWMGRNVDEVLTLLITNEDAIDINKFGDSFQKLGLDAFAFTPEGDLAMDDWPTLGTLIARSKRLIVFMDYNMNTAQVPYIMDEFKYYFETPFDPTDPDFPQCDIDRPAGASPDGRMFIVNHNLNFEILPGVLIPDLTRIETTNSVGSIIAQSDLCYGKYQRMPNVVLLDFVGLGDAMGAQNVLNKF
ncbi:PLC-like phosphodiesterase [Pseudomassariella vexata]|uniref:PLC-like phosphodiesterase n=1 Tax=Pseudomassariella vexata TaxID=1141098 RepID=A0A1Y2E2A9_9PEZI|nr:PLC-like phosphodiesterase [Pseudomassariella vexata]ORY65456.1 PLC-like phosphodiesterase [Pseudomassariella vexata]